MAEKSPTKSYYENASSKPQRTTPFTNKVAGYGAVGRVFACSVCKETFPDNPTLKSHLTAKNHWTPSATPVVNKTFICRQCQKCFESSNDLNTHLDAEGHRYKATETKLEQPQPENSVRRPATAARQRPNIQQEESEKSKFSRPASAPVSKKSAVRSEELAQSSKPSSVPASQPSKRSPVKADDTIEQVFSKLSLQGAAETVDELGVGNAGELKEVLLLDPSAVRAELRAVLSQHPFFMKSMSEKQPGSLEIDTGRTARLERQRAANLPIFASRDSFLARLRAEHVLIVTAATGSGKTTQLPQYAADDPAFAGGRIVCTQPRALAAVSIAKRIAEEYNGPDGKSESVGYTVGGGKPKLGSRIQLMTDAALVKLAQRESTLSSISVLIIDEAHERSLNTDLVLAIAKLVLAKRPNDFYIVVASATIDERPFLEYYFGSNHTRHEALKVPGKVFPITVEEQAIEYKKARDYVPKLVDTVISTLQKNSEGHCLVFLPGQNEIQQAIKLFESMCKTPNWVAKALYGSLPPEQQSEVIAFDDSNGQRRMVCFCTNVAETSLTVPGVRLVVDSGLAKEARYDAKRRMTVLEEVLISKSSADQRKGRSGRTAPGHCVRLYEFDALPREQIQPEILRASLDLVVLQLLTLGHDPRTFPFMDRPNEEDLVNAFNLMKSFQCLDDELNVTPVGRLLNSLPFDPRMSKFVIDCFVQANHARLALQLAAEVASILTAPGSLFFMGGDKSTKAEIKAKIASEAAVYSSDLLFLLQVYRDWLAAGAVNNSTGACIDCNKGIPNKGKERFCRPCRKSFTNERSLNNKVLSGLNRTVEDVMKTVLASDLFKQIKPSDELNGNMTEIMGQALLNTFTEQLCQTLIPHNPSEGVYLCSLKQRAFIQVTSAIVQRMGSNALSRTPYFIAYEITKLPNGSYITDRLHPVYDISSLPPHYSKSMMDIVLCYERKPLNSSFKTELRKWFLETYKDHEILAGLAFEYADQDHAVRVYGPAPHKPMIASLCASVIDARINHMLSYELTRCIGNGSAIVTARGGLTTERLEPVGLACRVRVDQKLPAQVVDDETFREWLIRASMVHGVKVNLKQDIKWTKFVTEDRHGVIVFKDQELGTRVQKVLAAYISHAAQGKGVLTNLDEMWGRTVVFWLEAEPPITKDGLETQWGLKDVFSCHVLT